MALMHTADLHGGDVATTWRGSGVQVTSAGLPGSTVGMTLTGKNSAQAWANPPASAPQSAQQYARSGRSVYWDALASGMSKAQAVKIALNFGARIPAAAHVSARPGHITPAIFNSVCTTTYGGPDNEDWGQACLVQSYLESQPGAYYLHNQVETSGAATTTNSHLVKLYGNYCWCGTSYTYTRVGWSPPGTISEGSPKTYTLTTNYGPFSVSVSETQQPSTLTPIFPSGVSEPAFGSQWTGNNNNGVVNDANSVAIVHEGPGAPGPARVVVGISWTM
jgi:hypothetical protein